MRKLIILFYAVWLILLTVIQPTAVQWISVFGISPDMFLVFVICSALVRGKHSGAVCGFIFGMVMDMMTGRMVGISAILYMYSGFAAGALKEGIISADSSIGTAGFVFAAALVYGILYLLGYSVSCGGPGLLYGIVRTVIPRAVYSGIAGFVFARPIRKSFRLIKDERSMAFGSRF